MILSAVLIPHDGNAVTVISHIVQTEIVPSSGWKQGVDHQGIVRLWTKAAKSGDNEVVKG